MNKNIIRQIRRRYIPAVVLILVLLIARQIITQYGISQDKYLSQEMSVVVKQRFLCQKISKDVMALHYFEESDLMVDYLEQLKLSMDTWETSFHNLRSENSKESPSRENSEIIMSLFDEVEENYQAILASSYSIIDIIERGTYSRSVLSYETNIIERNEEKFLVGMDRIFNQYQKENQVNMELIDTADTILFWIIIVIIILIVIYVYRPLQKTILKSLEDIKESDENIIKIFKMTHGALYLIEEESFKILLMNDEAEELIKKHEDKDEGINFAEEIQWMSIKCSDIMGKIKKEEKIKNLEVTINVGKGKSIIALLSAGKVQYQRTSAILIGLFDITLQKKAETEMKNMAITDELTGLYNRHFLDSKLKEETERLERYNEPLSMLIFDMDNFKKINDNWGHPVGDEVLKQTAQIARENIRKTDFLVRLGGEEFLLLMPHTKINGAMVVAEKICEAIENHSHPIVGSYTASFGVGQKKKSESTHAYYKRVDDALYRAKEGGRNRIFISEYRGSLQFASMRLEWKKEWNSGNLRIDQQHQELLNILNQLIHMSLISNEIDHVTQQFEIMVQYLLEHFEYEESVIRDIEYPDYFQHAKIHKELIEKLVLLKQSYEKSEVKFSALFVFMMDEVIVGHFLNEDVNFFPYIKKDTTIQSHSNEKAVDKY